MTFCLNIHPYLEVLIVALHDGKDVLHDLGRPLDASLDLLDQQLGVLEPLGLEELVLDHVVLLVQQLDAGGDPLAQPPPGMTAVTA